MRSLGILSVRENIIEGYKGRIRIEEKEQFYGKFSVIVAEISATGEEIQKLSPFRKRRLLKRGKKFLLRLGMDAISMTIECERAFGISLDGEEIVEGEVQPEEMPLAVKWALEKYQESPLGKAGWVLDRKCRECCHPILAEMSKKVQFLGLATDEKRRAEELEDVLCGEYGVNLEVVQPEFWQGNQADIFVDVERGRILFGETMILSGKKLSLDLRGYRVDLPKLLEEYPEFWSALSFGEWCLRKSG